MTTTTSVVIGNCGHSATAPTLSVGTDLTVFAKLPLAVSGYPVVPAFAQLLLSVGPTAAGPTTVGVTGSMT